MANHNRAFAFYAHATGGVTALWLGYGAPANLSRAVHAAPAEAAGGELARFQRSLSQRFPAAKKVVTGYSYGSVVSGYAAREGLEADELVLVGSPGVGVSHASQLGFDGSVVAVTNDGDPISFTATMVVPMGRPTAPTFGAQPFPTRPKGTHTSYWTDPVFLEGLRTIATPRTSQLAFQVRDQHVLGFLVVRHHHQVVLTAKARFM